MPFRQTIMNKLKAICKPEYIVGASVGLGTAIFVEIYYIHPLIEAALHIEPRIGTETHFVAVILDIAMALSSSVMGVGLGMLARRIRLGPEPTPLSALVVQALTPRPTRRLSLDIERAFGEGGRVNFNERPMMSIPSSVSSPIIRLSLMRHSTTTALNTGTEPGAYNGEPTEFKVEPSPRSRPNRNS